MGYAAHLARERVGDGGVGLGTPHLVAVVGQEATKGPRDGVPVRPVIRGDELVRANLRVVDQREDQAARVRHALRTGPPIAALAVVCPVRIDVTVNRHIGHLALAV